MLKVRVRGKHILEGKMGLPCGDSLGRGGVKGGAKTGEKKQRGGGDPTRE